MASFAAMIAGFCSCEAPSSDEGTFKPPVEAVEEPQPGMWASFESKFNRYYEGKMFEGQVNAAKIVEEWTMDRYGVDKRQGEHANHGMEQR